MTQPGQVAPGAVPFTDAELLRRDYATAEVTVLRLDTEQGRENLCTVVELLPDGIEPAPDRHDVGLMLEDSTRLALDRWHFDPVAAVEWYESCRSPAASPVRDKLNVNFAPLAAEPPWPHLAYESTPFWNDRLSMWRPRPGGTRRHQWVALPEDSAASRWSAWSLDQRKTIADWLSLEDELPLFDREVLWGSVNLIAPNPVFHSIHERLSKNDDRKLVLHLEPYPRHEIAGLQVVFLAHRPAGLSHIWTHELAGRTAVIDLPITLHELELYVVCPQRGLLFHSPPAVFLKQFVLNLGVGGEERKVQVPARSRARGPEEYVVPKVRYDVFSKAPKQPPPDALARLEADKQVTTNRDAGQKSEIWFNNDQAAGTKFLRKLIEGATEEVLLVDAYFRLEDLSSFALHTSVVGAQVKILGSQEQLRSKDPGPPERTQAEALLSYVRDVIRQDPDLKIAVRVARGSKAPIHDRFVVADGQAWSIGSSFGEFGKRGTMAIRLRHSSETKMRLDRAWEDATPLEEFVSEMAGNA